MWESSFFVTKIT